MTETSARESRYVCFEHPAGFPMVAVFERGTRRYVGYVMCVEVEQDLAQAGRQRVEDADIERWLVRDRYPVSWEACTQADEGLPWEGGE